jgi:hypothetical protein
MTWPVEEIRGVMVAQTNTAAQLDTEGGRNIWKGSLVRGITHQVHPPERQNEMIDRLEKAERNLERLSEEIFGRFEHPFTNIDERLWNNCQWAFRADATYLDIALQLAKEGQPDLTLLYLGGPDVVGHRFWRYREPESYLDRPSAEQVANFSGVIDDYYTYVDRALGELLLAHRSDTNVILVSDHGMHAANLRIRYDPKTPRGNINSGEHRDAPPGIFIAAGPAIEKDEGASAPLLLERGQLRRICSVLDITPTLLAMFGLPIGEDMDGKIVTSFLASDVLDEGRVKSIPTHDSREFFERRGTLVDPGELERLQQLRDLGYLGDE